MDDTENLEAVVIDESSGKIAVCGGPDVFVYQPYGIKGETLKVRIWLTQAWSTKSNGMRRDLRLILTHELFLVVPA